MDSLHLSVIAVLLYFNLPGSTETKSHQILSNISHHSDCWWDGKFLVNCSFTGISAIPEDISQTVITADLSYNNIKTFLCTDGRNKKWMLKHLNLSNNMISELSFTTFRNLPVLETLNLNGNAINTLTLDIPTPAHTSEKYREAYHLLPALKVLSVERNNLNTIPRGLGMLQSLQTVHLSSNDILQIYLNDFQNCSQLKNIYLQDNKITKIHPEAFKDLNKLQVVDLRGNALTTLLPQILINLNIFQLGVNSSNNPRICNCRLNAFKHLIRFDSIRKKWNISYNKSANISRKPLLPLSSFHLNCNDSVSIKTTVIPTGKTSVLNCDLDNTRGNGVSWWTPTGRISKDISLPRMTLDKMNNLVIYNADRTVEGFYICIFNATRKKYLIYNIEVKEKLSTSLVRKIRDTNTVFRQGKTEQDLALAVCLSVFITFVCAFCLGAFARPYLENLWRLMRRNKNSASEHIYSNQAFSNETLGRECSASIPTNTQNNLFICDENSLKNTCILPTETSRSYESVIYSNVHAPNTEEKYQKQSSNEIKAKQKSVFSNSKATSISNENYTDADHNGQSSIRMDCKNSNEITPRKLTNNDISLRKDSNYANNEDSEKSSFPPIPSRLNANSYSIHTESSDLDLPFTGETGFPFSGTQTHTNAQDSGNSEITNKSDLLQSEITEATPDSPEWKEMIPHNEPLSAMVFVPRTQNCDEELGVNGKINKISDAGDFILPNSCQKGINNENLSAYLTRENSLIEYYKPEGSNEKDDLADIFGDSSSDEGTVFTMSDCSSLADFELGQPSNNLPGCQSSVEKAGTNNETGKFSTVPESPSLAAELQHIRKDENMNNAYFETTVSYGSDTIMSETESPYTNKCSDHLTVSDSDTITFSSQKVPDMFKCFTNPESTIQNSISDSLCKQNTSYNDTMLVSSKHSPTYASHTENTPSAEAGLWLYQLSIQPQHCQRFSPPEQKENAAEISAEEHRERSSSEENHREGDITLRRNMNTSENNHFTFTPTDFGLNQIVRKTSLLCSNTAINESSLQSQPQSTTERCVMVTAEKEDSLPQGKQVKTPKTCAEKMQKGFNKRECDEYTETQDSTSCCLPEERQSCNVMADLHHLNCSGQTQSVFNTENYSQLDQSEENAYSSPPPQGFFNESVQYSLWSFPQKTRGNTISRKTDSSEMEDDTTLTELENNSTIAVNLQNSSEKLDQKNKTSVAQGHFFVKKKRAFDGFANVLQSRRTTNCNK
ncbi:leucine-rich repeat-containing protein 66 [Apteryx mantelli]|uniref:Leucine-rich repeat-containing protein 66 n=1 Tax=Apteryx mantelli TaxID=2696672 RepID=A0A8B7J1L3_9AVES|nr:PREDICTED: leucine-rich repeat-containing protein 66 [Apteryx mantelli mantelli]